MGCPGKVSQRELLMGGINDLQAEIGPEVAATYGVRHRDWSVTAAVLLLVKVLHGKQAGSPECHASPLGTHATCQRHGQLRASPTID